MKKHFQKFSKNEKKPEDIIILHKCTKNHDHMLHLRYGAWQMLSLLFILGYFLPFYVPPPCSNSQKIKIKKTPYNQMMYGSWDMVPDRRTDGRTDGKSDIQRWVPHLKMAKHTLKKLRCFPLIPLRTSETLWFSDVFGVSEGKYHKIIKVFLAIFQHCAWKDYAILSVRNNLFIWWDPLKFFKKFQLNLYSFLSIFLALYFALHQKM